MLINADEVLRLISQHRQVFIAGNKGEGKTSLAYRLAYELILKRKEVKYLFTNNNCVWADDIRKCTNRINGVIILDEGGIFIETKKEVSEFTALSRKLNVIYMIPSYSEDETPKAFKSLMITPEFHVYDSGIPLRVFRWEVKRGRKDHGYFAWWNPAEIYGVYSSMDPGENTQFILEEVNRITENLRKEFGRKNPIRKVEVKWWETLQEIKEGMEEK